MKITHPVFLMAIFATGLMLFACSSDSPSGGGDNLDDPLSELSSSSIYTPPPESSSSAHIPPPPPESSSSTYIPPPPPPSSSSTNPVCGGNEYNPSTYFCSGNTIVAKCGGNEYNLSTQFCSGNAVYAKCGGNEYNPVTHFCSGSTIVAKCGGNTYNPSTQECESGIVISFFTDTRDNRRYRTVDIGTQTWMAENLNFNTASGSKCPNNTASNCTQYGRQYDWATAMGLVSSYNTTLYNIAAANHRGVCPAGWHLPTVAEWTTLTTFIGANPGTKLKATSGWPLGGNGTDNYGFKALPAGYVEYGTFLDSYPDIGTRGLWWTVAEYNANRAYNRMMSADVGVYRYGDSSFDHSWTKRDMLSVRCVKD